MTPTGNLTQGMRIISDCVSVPCCNRGVLGTVVTSLVSSSGSSEARAAGNACRIVPSEAL